MIKYCIFLLLFPSVVFAWGSYTKQVDVFGVPVIATDSVSDAKLLHAAGVMAEYLDNNQDGRVDDLNIIEAMVNRHAFIFMSGGEFEQLIAPWPNEVFDRAEEFGQNLFSGETHPKGSSFEYGFDATLEEVLHLITHVGYASVYPQQFAESPGSDLTNAMDVARGGHFVAIPDRYPANAWYTYDDKTCDYSCMATEYFYWSLTSLLGAQSYSGRAEEVSEEWKLTTASELKSKDKRIVGLLSALPIKTLPKGRYIGTKLTITPID